MHPCSSKQTPWGHVCMYVRERPAGHTSADHRWPWHACITHMNCTRHTPSTRQSRGWSEKPLTWIIQCQTVGQDGREGIFTHRSGLYLKKKVHNYQTVCITGSVFFNHYFFPFFFFFGKRCYKGVTINFGRGVLNVGKICLIYFATP